MKEVMKLEDIMEIFECSKNVANRLKRELKAVSDITGNNRTIHRVDYENWCESKRIRSMANGNK
jgi:predicted phage-related endonuclease